MLKHRKKENQTNDKINDKIKDFDTEILKLLAVYGARFT